MAYQRLNRPLRLFRAVLLASAIYAACGRAEPPVSPTDVPAASEAKPSRIGDSGIKIIDEAY